MKQVLMRPSIFNGTVKYNPEIITFISKYKLYSNSDIHIVDSKDSIQVMLELEGEHGEFQRVNDKIFTLQSQSHEYPNIDINDIKCSTITSFSPKRDKDKTIFIVTFQKSTIDNSITEVFNDKINVIEECSLDEIYKVIRDIMINNKSITRFTYSDAKFDVYSHDSEVMEVNGLFTVSGQEVWFTIRCFQTEEPF